MSKEILRPAFAGMGLLASLALIGCGGGSGQTRPGGTGGTTGTGGTSSSTGGSSATGTGGAASGTGGAAVALACTANPTTALLSNFNITDSGDGGITASGQWGTTGMLTGHTFGYSGTMANDAGVTSKVSSSIAMMALVLSGSVNAADFAGGGMSFDTCVNSTNWTGVQFTLGGTADGCNITFMLQTESQEPPSNKGTCTATQCYQFPQVKVTIPTDGSATVVHFATDLNGTGMPAAPTDFEKEMFGLQWQFTSAAPPDGGVQVGCKPNMTISDVMWTTN